MIDKLVADGRTSVIVMESYCILRGLISKGIILYGPFNSWHEAHSYGDKNFPEDTREITIMRKEVVTHGGKKK